MSSSESLMSMSTSLNTLLTNRSQSTLWARTHTHTHTHTATHECRGVGKSFGEWDAAENEKIRSKNKKRYATADAPWTRYVSQNLVTCKNKFTTNPEQIAVMELEGYSWLTSSKQPRLVDCRIGVVNKLDCRRRRRRVLLTTRSTCCGEIKSGVWNRVPEGSTLILKDTQIFL